MNLQENYFENKGLKLDKERVLTYSKLKCPFDCRYCFVDDLEGDQEKNAIYLSDEQIEIIKDLPEDISLVMLGCDTEFFQNKKISLEILNKLIEGKKDISVITKMSLDENFIKELKEISDKLADNGNFFSFSISLPCFESSKFWEPKAPSPSDRIETLKKAWKNGIKTLVAIRPLLPSDSLEELKNIVDLTSDFCSGYYSGPLYLKDLSLIANVPREDLLIEEVEPVWMPSNNIFYKVEKNGQMDFLAKVIEEKAKKIFDGAAEAIGYLKKIS